MPSSLSPVVCAWFAGRHGVARHGDLLPPWGSRAAKIEYLLATGILTSFARGVYRLTAAPRTERQQAALACAVDLRVVISSTSAGRWWGLRRLGPDRGLQVTIPRRRNLVVPGAIVHRGPLEPSDIVERDDGIRLTSPPRQRSTWPPSCATRRSSRSSSSCCTSSSPPTRRFRRQAGVSVAAAARAVRASPGSSRPVRRRCVPSGRIWSFASSGPCSRVGCRGRSARRPSSWPTVASSGPTSSGPKRGEDRGDRPHHLARRQAGSGRRPPPRPSLACPLGYRVTRVTDHEVATALDPVLDELAPRLLLQPAC